MRILSCAVASLLFVAANVVEAAPIEHIDCDRCNEWNRAVEPFRIFGNTYYVGVGLSSVLIVGDQGHILLDGGLPQSAPLIESNIRKLGFDPEDVQLILNSHAHYDHAGGISALQRLTHAPVAASPKGAEALRQGRPTQDDPQAGFKSNGFPAVSKVRTLADRETLRVGDLAVTAQFTPGHTPGSTTWTWKSCEKSRCLNIVYADSLNAISAPGFRYSDSPEKVKAFHASIDRVEKLSCDVLITVHPEISELFQRRDAAAKSPDAFVDKTACDRYAKKAAAAFEQRLKDEAKR